MRVGLALVVGTLSTLALGPAEAQIRLRSPAAALTPPRAASPIKRARVGRLGALDDVYPGAAKRLDRNQFQLQLTLFKPNGEWRPQEVVNQAVTVRPGVLLPLGQHQDGRWPATQIAVMVNRSGKKYVEYSQERKTGATFFNAGQSQVIREEVSGGKVLLRLFANGEDVFRDFRVEARAAGQVRTYELGTFKGARYRVQLDGDKLVGFSGLFPHK